MNRETARNAIAPFRAALYDREGNSAKKILAGIAGDAVFHMCAPFGDFDNSDGFYDAVFAPLFTAMPDCERRDYIVIAGEDADGNEWVGAGGYYFGSFLGPWLEIPPTGHVAHMRFHEFYRIADGKVAEFQAIWDIPEVMMQAGAWPLAPSLGREWCPSAPVTQDGLAPGGSADEALASRNHVFEMYEFMQKHPAQGPEAMEMERFWHEKMTWYGPAGIGTARGIAGFRHWHQIPFLGAMPDRGQHPDAMTNHYFAEGQYVAVTGWPNMMQTLSNDGWLGIAASGQRIPMRSLDFWRLENGKIRENWVLVDLLDVYANINVDVFGRLREFNKARNMGAIDWKKDY